MADKRPDEEDDGIEVGSIPDLALPSSSGQPEEPELEVNGYRLLRELQRGGQAAIFLAIQKSTGRRVALKLIFSGPYASELERARMDQEVRILAALDHPNIVSVVDRGETADGSQYFVMNYVDGRMLNEFLDDFRRDRGDGLRASDIAELLKLFRRICDAINAAHLRGIVHRDLKPANIVIDAYGEPHILDFGLAHTAVAPAGDPAADSTRLGEFVGSLEWASPEQASGDASKIDTRTDVYALGVMLYEMVTGEFPYDVFDELRNVLDHIVATRPIPPSKALARNKKASSSKEVLCDAALDKIILKALSKAREDRFQNAGVLARAVGEYLDTPRAAPPPRRLPMVLAAAGAVALAALVGMATWHFRQSDKDPSAIRVAYNEGIYGYAIDGNDVVFIFEPTRYPLSRNEDGSLVEVSGIESITHVQIAGSFNEWKKDRADWRMRRISPNRFELRKNLGLFKARSEWPFKFFVNGEYWIGAPGTAANREVVVADTATFNIVLMNPRVGSDAQRRAIRGYRNTIESAWPGQGANFVLDESNRYHFTFTHLAPGQRMTDLEPLRGLPIDTLDIGQTKVTDISPLAEMTTLTDLIISDGTFSVIMMPVMEAINSNDIDRAEAALHEVFDRMKGAPAFANALDRLSNSLANLRSLREQPDQPVPHPAIFRGHRYAFIITPMNWHDAQHYAVQCGGDLVAVSSKEENAWLVETFTMRTLGRTIWLGGSDDGSESFWRWTSGDKWRFENWARPEPNNEGGTENALAMRPDGWWMDVNGHSLSLPFVIKWSK